MFDSTKYIIVEDGGLAVPVVFSYLQKHSEVAAGRKVIAAGFVSFRIDWKGINHDDSEMVAVCYGQSVSLNVKSRGVEDSELIERFILNK